MNVSLEQANIIIHGALALAREHQFMPLTVCVLDAGGHVVAMQREDRSGILRPDIATGKAWGSLGMGASSRMLRDRLVDRPHFISALTVASQGRFIPVPGGVLIRDATNTIIGAVGISGDTSEKDELCAIRGIEAANLIPDPTQPADDWDDSSL